MTPHLWAAVIVLLAVLVIWLTVFIDNERKD